MIAGYTIVGGSTPDELVRQVGEWLKKGWQPIGSPFTAPHREGSKLQVHAKNPRLVWWQAMGFPMMLAQQPEEAEAAPGPGRQAMSRDEYDQELEDDREPITIVAGMGRCGTSLVMAMLAAAGMPTGNAKPMGYEDVTLRDAIANGDYSWCESMAGNAMKILGLFQYPPPPRGVWPCRIIYLTRDKRAQAESWLAYRLRLGERDNPPETALLAEPEDREAWIEAEIERLERTEKASTEALQASGHPWITMRLETLQRDPQNTVATIADFCHLTHQRLPEMVACVKPAGTWGNVPA